VISSSEILKATILIVDDLEANVKLLEQMLRNAGYNSITSAMDPLTVCNLHRNHCYDLILLDIQMPVMSGFQVMEELGKLENDDYLPVIVITAQPEHKLQALKLGAKDFVSKPFERAEVLARVHNMLEVRLLHKELHSFNEVLEKRVRERTAELQDSYQETIFTMTRAAEYKDEDTGAHVLRISSSCRKLAMFLTLSDEFVDKIFSASPMHDIGKIGIPDHILLKPGVFTPDEWEVMKEHTVIGGEILGNSKSPYLLMGSEIALNHHERWNGGGYPNGKRGEEIPLAARIMSICDVYDSLRSKRHYKPAFGHQKSMNIIMLGDGRTKPEHFDPMLFAAFTENHQAFRDIFDAYTVKP
jgi:putative two-component system response regulator